MLHTLYRVLYAPYIIQRVLYAPYIIQRVCECCMFHTLYRECVSVVCSIHYTESVCSIHYTESV